MANIGKYDQSKFLKAEDLGTGEDYTRIIQAVTEEEVGQDNPKAIIPVVWFRGDYKKGLGLSAKINRKMLMHNLGSAETDDWIGRKVFFFRTMTEYQGKPVPCIRFKPKEEFNDSHVAPEPGDEFSDDKIPF
jgi:hypothetical protein